MSRSGRGAQAAQALAANWNALTAAQAIITPAGSPQLPRRQRAIRVMSQMQALISMDVGGRPGDTDAGVPLERVADLLEGVSPRVADRQHLAG